MQKFVIHGGKDCDDVNMPKSRIFKDGRYEYNNSIDTSWDMTLFENALNVLIFNPDDNYTVFDYKLAKRIDQIIDDGIAKSGKFRALVGSTVGDIEYDDIDGIDCNGEDKNLCSAYELVFKLDLDK